MGCLPALFGRGLTRRAYHLVWMMGLVAAFSLAMCRALCASNCIGADDASPARAEMRLTACDVRGL